MQIPQNSKHTCQIPRVILSGLRGGSGKTIVTIGLIGALQKKGYTVAPFKKGPDYIDPQWLTTVSGSPCRNLDLYFMSASQIRESVAKHGRQKDIAVIEGNRGLFDGMDEEGIHSTAELSKVLGAPIILIVDCTKTTRTIAASVLGCRVMDPDTQIRGVILNQVACKRQESLIRSCIEKEARLPVLGTIRRLKDFEFPERHLGLYPPVEYQSASEIVERLIDRVTDNIDLERIGRIASSAFPLHLDLIPKRESSQQQNRHVRIGIFWDEAFHFYYPDNLEALEDQGAQIIRINSLNAKVLPALDALYIGGGFPEIWAERLAQNEAFRTQLRQRINEGLPVLAECGGLVYLSEAIVHDKKRFPLVGVFPITFAISNRPQGHGYTKIRVDRENPFFPIGTEFLGHEFRYSAVQECSHDCCNMAFTMLRGFGFDGSRDGLVYNNTLASFCHHHVFTSPEWCNGLIRKARLTNHSGVEKNIWSGTYG